MNNQNREVEEWGEAKGIFAAATLETQWWKLHEEIGEVWLEITNNDSQHSIRTEIGDVLFVATLMAKMAGSTAEECLQMAIDKNVYLTFDEIEWLAARREEVAK